MFDVPTVPKIPMLIMETLRQPSTENSNPVEHRSNHKQSSKPDAPFIKDEFEEQTIENVEEMSRGEKRRHSQAFVKDEHANQGHLRASRRILKLEPLENYTIAGCYVDPCGTCSWSTIGRQELAGDGWATH